MRVSTNFVMLAILAYKSSNVLALPVDTSEVALTARDFDPTIEALELDARDFDGEFELEARGKDVYISEPQHGKDKPFLMPIEDKFKIRGGSGRKGGRRG